MVQTIKQLPRWGVYALLIYMPFHVFLSQWIGTSMGGLSFWKVAKDLATIVLLALTAILVLWKVPHKTWRPYASLLVLAGVYAALHIILYIINKNTTLDIALLASGYNNRFIWILLIGIGSGLLLNTRPKQQTIVRLVLIVSTIVCLIGILQWFLPSDVLTHFGYAKELGVKPNFFINENPNFPRIFATFRDPNSFAAYLIIPSLLLMELIRTNKRRKLSIALLVLHLVVVYLSFSRAAWLGLLLGVSVLLFVHHRRYIQAISRRYWPLLLSGALVMIFITYAVRNTSTFRSIVLKADDTNASTEMDSDEYHVFFIKEGLRDVSRRPTGYGPGTAGIVSIHNGAQGQLTENYYVQIAHEVGILGLAVFIAIWALVCKLLYSQEQSSLRTVLLVSAVVYAVMAMVMHLWTNEAIAFGWWGLAGLVIFTGNSHNKTSKKRMIYS